MPDSIPIFRRSSMSELPGSTYAGPMLATMPRRLPARSVPPQAYFAGSAVFHYLGPPFALAHPAPSTAYTVLAPRVARAPALAGIDGLAGAMLCALVFVFPIGFADAAHALTDPIAVLAGVGVGVSSSVVPYVCDQLAMARLARATYALFVALLPATATVIGVVVLQQLPTAVDLAGIGLVMAGVALHRQAA